ncbi:MAG: hypothetical protein ACJAS1_005737 [Oleiphilaceae bacterium]|jgi:hypothetical protein
MNLYKNLIIVPVLVLAAGCATKHERDTGFSEAKEPLTRQNPSEDFDPDIRLRAFSQDEKVLNHLTHAARNAQRQWGNLNSLTELRTGNKAPVLELTRVDPSLKRVFQFPDGFQGTLEQLVTEIASVSGYEYLAPQGKRPLRGVPVIFVQEFRTLAEYLWDGGQQAGDRADVVIDMKSETLHVIYSGF